MSETSVVTLSTEENGGGNSVYNTNETVRIVLPGMAIPSGRFLHQAGGSIIKVYDLTQEDLEKRLKIRRDKAEIRAVRLGYDDVIDDYIDVRSRLNNCGGVARGVRLVGAKKSP